MCDERWLPIPGFEGLYEVSDQGRVRSLPRPKTRGIVLRQHLGGGGRRQYWQLRLSRNGHMTLKKVHHLVLAAFVGPRPLGQVTRHGPSGHLDNRLINLCYGTPAENERDKDRDGTRVKPPRLSGEASPRARLTSAEVEECRTRFASGEQGASLAREFGVGRSQMSRILRGLNWRDAGGAVVGPSDGRGEGNGRAKLTRAQVAECRSRFADGEHTASLAREFDVSWTSMKHAITGRNWRCLDEHDAGTTAEEVIPLPEVMNG